MATVVNDTIGGVGALGGSIPFGVPVGGFGGFGGGWGGGGIEALVLLALLGRDGFGRGGDHGHCRDGNGGGDSVAALSAVIAALNNRNDPDRCCEMATAVIAKLGSLEGAIPAVSCELQLALQGAVASLTAQGNTNAAALTSQLNALQLGQLVQSQNILTAVAAVDTNVDRQACETRGAIFQSEARITALINAQEVARLNAENVKLANEVVELRHEHRHADSRRELDSLRISIENNNTAVAAQAQFQQQRQVDLTFARIERDNCDLRNALSELIQINRATNQNILVGNTGVTTTGPQTANPTNVKA